MTIGVFRGGGEGKCKKYECGDLWGPGKKRVSQSWERWLDVKEDSISFMTIADPEEFDRRGGPAARKDYWTTHSIYAYYVMLVGIANSY